MERYLFIIFTIIIIICSTSSTIHSFMQQTDGISNGIQTASFKEVSSMTDTVASTPLVTSYKNTSSTTECSIRCLQEPTCMSFFINKRLKQCRLNYCLLTSDMTNTSVGWKYYEFVSHETEGNANSPEPCARGSYCCRQGLCLKLFADQKYWEDASEFCVSLGERLLIIDSQWKQQLVVQMVVEMGGDDDIDIGGELRLDQGTRKWFWQDGSVIKELFWGASETSRSFLTLEIDDNFLWGTTTGDYRTHDYICEQYK